MERRVRRSTDRQKALCFYLESLTKVHGLSALCVSNREGKLVAGAGRDVSALAEVMPDAYRGLDSPRMDALTAGEDLYARAIQVDGEPLFLGALGAPVRPFWEAEAGILRILAGT